MPITSLDEYFGQQDLQRPAGTYRQPVYAPEPKSFLGRALDIVSRPGYSTVGPVYEALKSYQDTGEIDWEAAGRGFIEGLHGKQYMTSNVLYGLDVHRSLMNTGMDKRRADMLIAGMGFVGDVILDWSNLIGVGAVRGIARSAAAPMTAKAGALMAKSRAMTGLARLFNQSFGFPQGYHDIKYFARHAVDAELTEILNVSERLAKRMPSLDDRAKVMDQLGKPGGPPAHWDDESKALFGELRRRLEDIGQKWVDGGWMHPKALRDAMKEGYDPRYYMLWDPRSKKWFVDEAGPHGIPGSMFDKTAKPGTTKQRLFQGANWGEDFRKYAEKHGIPVVDDITKTPKDLKEGIHIGKDPIYGYALRASEQARFMGHQAFVDEVLAKFGTKADDVGEVLEGIKQGGLLYKAKRLSTDTGFYLPKGSLRFFSNTMIDDKKLRGLLRSYGAAARRSKGKQLPAVLRLAEESMKKRGFSEGEIQFIQQWLTETGGLGVEGILKDIESMREVIARLGAASEGPLIELEKFEAIAAGLGQRMVGISKKVPVYKLPRDIANDLNKLRISQTDEGARFLRHWFDKSLNMWKGYATVANPGFHFRNMYSNWFNMYLADVHPAKIMQRSYQSLGVQGVVDVADDVVLGRGLTYGQIREEVQRLGVRGRGWAAADIGRHFAADMKKALRGGKAEMTARLNPTSDEFELISKGRKLGTGLEDNARISLYIDRRLKGATAKDAAIAVRKYLFDYNELTEAEKKVFKRVWPFYTWMRKNIPLQFEHLLTKPYKYSNVAKAIRNIGFVDPETDQERSVRPDYFNDLEAFKVPLQNAFKGVPGLGKFFDSDDPIYLNPNFPFQDLNRIEGRDLIASLNPFIKIAVELGPIAVGKPGIEYFSRRPLYRYPGERDPLPPGLTWLGDLPDEIKDIIGVGPTLSLTEGREVVGMDARYLHVLKSLNPFFMNMARAVPEAGTGYAPARYEDRRRFHILSWIMGIKLMPMDMAKAEMVRILQSKEDLRKIKQYIRYESPSTGEVHDLLQKWEHKYAETSSTSRSDRLRQAASRRKDILDQASR